MAIVRKEVSDRSAFGKFVKWIFIEFNVLMLLWAIVGINATSEVSSTAINDAERAGAAIGATIGMGLVIMLWALGDIILGIFVLLTRRKKIVEVEE
jgi:hypothetical protein